MRRGVTSCLVVLVLLSLPITKRMRALAGLKLTGTPISCPGLADGATATSGVPWAARTSLAGRTVKLRTMAAARALPTRSVTLPASTVKR